jgi:hypothetical protein
MKTPIAAAMILALAGTVGAQGVHDVVVTVDPTRIRSIGGIEVFDRNQFITIHESYGSTDLTDEDVRYLEEDLEVSYGRNGGFLSWLAAETRADPDDPDRPDVEHISEIARDYRSELSRRRSNPAHTRQVVLCTHPERMFAMPDNDYAPWGPRTYEAVAEFTAQALRHFWPDEGRPIYLEVLNEPFVHADEIGTTAQAMSEQHNVVARRVRELNPGVKVGGYTAAWVEVEARNFEHWNNWQKMFMDIAGAEMDFFSYHIYDGVNVKGTPRNRTGSNSEAIMDLIDTYSHILFGTAKPLVISEYGMIPEGNMGNMAYSPRRTALMLRSLNGQLFTYMDHPDRIVKTVPFILGKAMWTYRADRKPDEANPFLLWRLDGEDFVKTDLGLFYRFWKGVTGEWRAGMSSNPDIRVHLLADETGLNLLLTNLDQEAKNVALRGLEGLESTSVALRTLTTHGDGPVLAERPLPAIPGTLELATGESALLRIGLGAPVQTSGSVTEIRCYAAQHLLEIEAGEPLTFSFSGLPTGDGTARLRISAGRENAHQVLPESVLLNGHALDIPENWAGDDQAGRPMFFGMVEVPAPMALIEGDSTVEVTYPDSGGKLASVVLQLDVERQQ